MADPKFPYVKWRDGRPRSSHGAYARVLGFVDGDLRHPPYDEKGRAVGAWFNLQEASDFSDKRRSEIEAARRAGKLPKKITVRKRTTIEDGDTIVDRQAGTPSVLQLCEIGTGPSYGAGDDRDAVSGIHLGPGKHPVAPRTQPARGHGVRSSGRPHRAGRDAGIFRVGRRSRCDRTGLDRRQPATC